MRDSIQRDATRKISCPCVRLPSVMWELVGDNDPGELVVLPCVVVLELNPESKLVPVVKASSTGVISLISSSPNVTPRLFPFLFFRRDEAEEARDMTLPLSLDTSDFAEISDVEDGELSLDPSLPDCDTVNPEAVEYRDKDEALDDEIDCTDSEERADIGVIADRGVSEGEMGDLRLP